LCNDIVIKSKFIGKEMVYELTTVNDHKIKATADHKFYIHNGKGYSPTELRNITKGDKVKVLQQKPNLVGFDVDWYKGYIKGAFAGDGYIKVENYRYKNKVKTKRKTPCHLSQFSSIDRVFIEEVVNAIENTISYKPVIKKCNRKTSKNNVVYRFSSTKNELYNLINEAVTDKEYAGYLAGFFDAEGHCSKASFYISQLKNSRNIKLCEDILQYFGFSYSKKIGDNLCNIVIEKKHIHNFYTKIRPRIARKFDWFYNWLDISEVESIIELGIDEVFAIETHSTKKYIANGFLTKNCDSIEKFLAGEEKSIVDYLVKMERMGYIEHLGGGAHLVFTGGEPLLQQENIVHLLNQMHKDYNIRPYVEVCTNGVLAPMESLVLWTGHFHVSPKLSNSGVPIADRLALTVLQEYPDNSIFNFVIIDKKDFAECMDLISKIKVERERVWLMPGMESSQYYCGEMVKKHKFNYNERMT